MAHTPGPWTVRKIPDESGRYWIDSDAVRRGKRIAGTLAECYSTGCGDGTPEDNARLIAAAPYLLGVVRELIADCEAAYPHIDTLGDEWPDLLETYIHAKAAIAKASGQTP